MTQFVKRESSEHLFSLAMDLTTETLKNLIDLAKKTEDQNVLRYIQVMYSDIRYGTEIIEKEAAKMEFYEVKTDSAGASNA